MAKQAKQAKSIPEIYQGLDRNTELLKYCIVEDIHGQFFGYKTAAENNIVTPAVQKKWDNWEKFNDEGQSTIMTYHANLFDAEPPKDQALVLTSTYVWYKLFEHIENKNAFNQTRIPTRAGRKSTIGNSEYRRGEPGTGTLKTPQALASLKLFDKALEKDGTDHEEGRVITEDKLRKYIEDNAAELRTRQDPWRIFQYYRPQLIEQKLIKRR